MIHTGVKCSQCGEWGVGTWHYLCDFSVYLKILEIRSLFKYILKSPASDLGSRPFCGLEPKQVAMSEVSGEAEETEMGTGMGAKNEPWALRRDSTQNGAGGLWV